MASDSDSNPPMGRLGQLGLGDLELSANASSHPGHAAAEPEKLRERMVNALNAVHHDQTSSGAYLSMRYHLQSFLLLNAWYLSCVHK